jgi:hypothetical protein
MGLVSRAYAPAEAEDTVRTVLADVLHYDRDRPAHYANGRVMTDDVYDMRCDPRDDARPTRTLTAQTYKTSAPA